MKIVSILALLLMSFSALADSYNDDLNELFEVTGVINNYISLNTQIIGQMQTGYLQEVDESIDGSKFSIDQKKQAGEILKARFATMVKNYEAHVKKTMPYDKVVQEIYLPLYKETYSANDVKALLKFYKSPIGKKSLEFSQRASQEASKRTAEKYDSTIADFVEKQIKENVAIVKNEIAIQVK